MITEEWQVAIVQQARLEAQCLVGAVANMLYPGITMADAREARLREEGGDLVARLEQRCAAVVGSCTRELDEWDAAHPESHGREGRGIGREMQAMMDEDYAARSRYSK